MKKLLLLPFASTLLLSACFLDGSDEGESAEKAPATQSTVKVSQQRLISVDTLEIDEVTDSTITYIEKEWYCDEGTPKQSSIRTTNFYEIENKMLTIYEPEDCHKDYMIGDNSSIYGSWKYAGVSKENDRLSEACDSPEFNVQSGDISSATVTSIISKNQQINDVDITFECFAESMLKFGFDDFEKDMKESFPDFKTTLIDCSTIEFDYGNGYMYTAHFDFYDGDYDMVFHSSYNDKECNFTKTRFNTFQYTEESACENEMGEYQICNNNLLFESISNQISSLNKGQISKHLNTFNTYLQNSIEKISTP